MKTELCNNSSSNNNSSNNNNAASLQEKATYTAPAIEIIEMEIEGAILYESGSATGTNPGDGGDFEL